MASPTEPDELSSELEEIEIIEFKEADAPEISILFARVWPQAVEYPELWRKRRCLSPEQVIEEMRKGYHYFGARIDGQIVGLYKAILVPEGLLGEQQTIHPNYRHRGLVRAMYRQFINYAKQVSAPANLCNILLSQQTMRRLVESFGFKPHGPPYEQAPNMLVQLYKKRRESP